MKKLLIFILLCTTILTLAVISVSADDGITVKVNNNVISFDVPPQIINDRTMVPMRAIFEDLLATVEWDETTQTVTAKRGLTTIKILINDNKLYINDKPVKLDTSAQIIDGRTLVPVRAIAESFCLQVDWDWNSKTVLINELEPKSVLFNLDNYIVGDLWNDGICDIKWYIENGTDASGEELDINATIDLFKNNYGKKASYDAYINNLDSFYADIKTTWAVISSETDRMYNIIISSNIKPKDSSVSLNYNKFNDYMYKFSDLIN